MAEINIGMVTGGKVRNLSGHERGLSVREELRIDELDVAKEPVRVVIPPDLYAVTTSFFQGMFAKSVKRFGSRDAFLEHYRFDGTTSVLRQIDRGILAVLTERHNIVAA